MASPPTDLRPGLPELFRLQAKLSGNVGARLYEFECEVIAAELVASDLLDGLFVGWADPRVGDAVPLRLLASLHRLALQGEAPELGPFYSTTGGAVPERADLVGWQRLETALPPSSSSRRRPFDSPQQLSACRQVTMSTRRAVLGGFLSLGLDVRKCSSDPHDCGGVSPMRLTSVEVSTGARFIQQHEQHQLRIGVCGEEGVDMRDRCRRCGVRTHGVRYDGQRSD